MAEEHQKGDKSSHRGLFDFMKKNKETDGEKKDQEEVIATEFHHKVEVSKEDKHDENKEGGLVHKLHRSDYSSSSSSDEEEGDDEDKKKRKKEKKEKKGLKEEIKEKLPGHHKEQEEEQEDKEKDHRHHHHDEEEEIKEKLPGHHKEQEEEQEYKEKDHHHHHHDEEDTNIAIEKIHAEEEIYSEPSHPAPAPPPPHSEAEGGKKGLLEKIKNKLPGQHKKAEAEHEVVPTATATVAEGEAPEKKGFLDKIKDKIPGLHSKAPEEDKKDVEFDQPPSST